MKHGNGPPEKRKSPAQRQLWRAVSRRADVITTG